MHVCYTYENVVNGTKLGYKVMNTLKNLAGSKNGLGVRVWIVAITFMQR